MRAQLYLCEKDLYDNPLSRNSITIENCLIKEYDWDDTIKIKHISTGTIDNIDVKDVSLYSHFVVINAKDYYIARMLCKNGNFFN